MTIDGIKYKNVFVLYKSKNISRGQEPICIICQKNVTNKDYYAEGVSRNAWKVGIFITDKNGFSLNMTLTNNYWIYICKECGKTPVMAENAVIPMLKILYGKEIKIGRVNEKTKEIKEFWY